MTIGDWAQVITGVVGIFATLVVARMVYRLESRDRNAEKTERQATEAEARQLVTQRADAE